MVIKDITQNKLLSTQAKEATSLKDKTLGLILKSNPRFLLLHTRFGIHTFGMRDKIDLIILDNTNHIVAIKKNLKSFSAYFWNPKYSKVLEMPAGVIEESGIKLGDLIRIS